MRLDVVPMLILRDFFADTFAKPGDKLHIYGYCDLSPQWRGVESFSASFHLYDSSSNIFLRRLVPCIALSSDLFDAF